MSVCGNWFSVTKMTGLRVAVLLCVFIIQRVASQGCNCQSELYISIDDLISALNNGPGIPGLTNQGQSCGCQQSSNQINQQCGNQDCGCQPSQPKPCRPIQVNQALTLGNQCGCQPSISINQPSQQCGCQPSISFSQQNQQCGCQPSISVSQSSQQCGCQPSISISQPSQQCGCQPSISINQGSSCGCQPSISFSQPSQCGCQPVSINQGNCGCQSQSVSFQPIGCGCQQISKSSQCNQVVTAEVPAYIVPAALLEAPPYGIIFAGDNLLIDGAVQVCGNLPFSSIVELSGVVPSSGSGCVQYSCGDGCECN